jgi:hypothetical protein
LEKFPVSEGREGHLYIEVRATFGRVVLVAAAATTPLRIRF